MPMDAVPLQEAGADGKRSGRTEKLSQEGMKRWQKAALDGLRRNHVRSLMPFWIFIYVDPGSYVKTGCFSDFYCVFHEEGRGWLGAGRVF